MKAAMFRNHRRWSIIGAIGCGLLSAQIVASTAHGRSEATPSPTPSLTEVGQGSGVERNVEPSARDAWRANSKQTALDPSLEDQSFVCELTSDLSGDLDHGSDVASDPRLALAVRCCIPIGGGCVAGKCGAGGTPVPCPCWE